MNPKTPLALVLISLLFSSCNDNTVITKSHGEKLNEASVIGNEIKREFKIDSDTAFLLDGEIARIEFKVTDPKIDHQSLATDISKMKSVQRFKGALQLLFIHYENEANSGPPKMWIKYDAKTAKRI